MFVQLFLVAFKAVLSRLELVAAVCELFRFTLRLSTGCEDAVFDKRKAKITELLVDPVANPYWEVLFNFVD